MKTLLSKIAMISMILWNENLLGQPLAKTVFNIPNYTYRIEPNSILKLEGKTNLGSFHCNCTDQFPPQTFLMDAHDDKTHVTSFRQTVLKLKIKRLDCGNKMMNKDLQKALNADVHPDIQIELMKVTEDKCNRLTELKDWIRLKALTRISLNGCFNDYWLDINAKKIAANQYRFIGVKTLSMQDFGVTPPTALMGMVKVNGDIKINLDLKISVDNAE